jgi:two-component system alkaline phosphatase synthesis response regulator PhoP
MKNDEQGKQKILLIEDEKDMVTGLRFNLEVRDYEVSAAPDGETGMTMALDQTPDLVLLDLMLPGISGYEVCRRLKEQLPRLPIIMLTARGQESDIVTGLNLGADDYITKPFSVLELVARIQAVFRRSGSGSGQAAVFRNGSLSIDFKLLKAEKDGQALDLTSREFEILECLARHRGELVTREQLMNRVWGYFSYPFTRTIDAHIASLRRKIERLPGEPELIKTIHGKGYKLV